MLESVLYKVLIILAGISQVVITEVTTSTRIPEEVFATPIIQEKPSPPPIPHYASADIVSRMKLEEPVPTNIEEAIANIAEDRRLRKEKIKKPHAEQDTKKELTLPVLPSSLPQHVDDKLSDQYDEKWEREDMSKSSKNVQVQEPQFIDREEPQRMREVENEIKIKNEPRRIRQLGVANFWVPHPEELEENELAPATDTEPMRSENSDSNPRYDNMRNEANPRLRPQGDDSEPESADLTNVMALGGGSMSAEIDKDDAKVSLNPILTEMDLHGEELSKLLTQMSDYEAASKESQATKIAAGILSQREGRFSSFTLPPVDMKKPGKQFPSNLVHNTQAERDARHHPTFQKKQVFSNLFSGCWKKIHPRPPSFAYFHRKQEEEDNLQRQNQANYEPPSSGTDSPIYIDSADLIPFPLERDELKEEHSPKEEKTSTSDLTDNTRAEMTARPRQPLLFLPNRPLPPLANPSELSPETDPNRANSQNQPSQTTSSKESPHINDPTKNSHHDRMTDLKLSVQRLKEKRASLFRLESSIDDKLIDLVGQSALDLHRVGSNRDEQPSPDQYRLGHHRDGQRVSEQYRLESHGDGQIERRRSNSESANRHSSLFQTYPASAQNTRKRSQSDNPASYD